MLTLSKKSLQVKEIPRQPSPILNSTYEKIWLQLRVLNLLFKTSFKIYRNPIKALKLIQGIRDKYGKIFGSTMLNKVTKVDGRYYWRFGDPGFPSGATAKMYENELNRLAPYDAPTGMRTLIIAITKKCPLNCKHCFEWDNLNKKETLKTEDIINLVRKYQDFGTTQIMFSGGEPMLRVNDIYKALNASASGTDFWVITSGLGFTLDRAKRLKNAGLTGVMISLDHWDAAAHNEFRGYANAYNMAINAIIYANKVGLATTLSLCTTKEFVTQKNITAYMNLARKLGVTFIQFLDPRATGKYHGQHIELEPEQIRLLEETYLKYNSSEEYDDYPIIDYLGYHQRNLGCFGAGDRFFYIDTDGDTHVCPFCASKVASAVQFPAKDIVQLLGQNKCMEFEQNMAL